MKFETIEFKDYYLRSSPIATICTDEKIKKIDFEMSEDKVSQTAKLASPRVLTFDLDTFITDKEIKDFINTVPSSKGKEEVIKSLSIFFKWANSAIVYNRLDVRDKDRSEYRLKSRTIRKFTLDNLDWIFDKKVPKSLLRSILYDLDLTKSSRDLVVKYTMDKKFDFFRILGKTANFQFTKQELLDIIAKPEFSNITSSGTFGSGETADIMNRRAIIMHQKNVDEEVFMAIIDTLSGNSTALESFLKTAQRDKILKRFEGIPAVQVFLKLQ